MATTLGTKLGTMLGTELADMVEPGPPAPLVPISALSSRHRYRVSQAVVSGGNVVSIPNEGSAGGQLDPQGTVAAPTADAALNGALSLVFSGAQFLRSSLAASEFIFLHSGDSTVYMVCVPASGVGIRYETSIGSAASIGVYFGVNGTTGLGIRHSATNGTVQYRACTNAAGGGGLGVGMVLRGEATNTTGALYRDGALSLAATITGSPNAGAIAKTLEVGGRAGNYSFGRIAEILQFDRVLTAPELASVDAEMFATYGKHA